MSVTNQGTGNYLGRPLHLGRRGDNSASRFFSGNLYGALITRFSAANLSTDSITAVEALLTAEITGAP